MLKALKKYDKEFKANALASIQSQQLIAYEQEFRKLARGKRFGAWPKKAIESIDESCLDKPLHSTLTSRTLELYSAWLADKCVEDSLVSAKSVVEFLEKNEPMKRHIAYLDCKSTMSISELEASLCLLLE